MLTASRKRSDMRKVLPFCLLFLCLTASVGLAAGIPAAAVTTKSAAPKNVVSDDPLGRSTPQGAVLGFVKATGDHDYGRAVEYLDTREPLKKAEQLAMELQSIMDRGLSGDLDSLSRNAEGSPTEGLPPKRQRVGMAKVEAETLDIQLDRVERAGIPVWLFSSDTLQSVPRVYERLNAPFPDRYVPAVLKHTTILYVSLWRWLSIFVVLPILYFAARLISYALLPLLRFAVRRISKRDDEKPLQRLRGPFNLLILALAFYAYAPLLNSVLARIFWMRAAETVIIVSLTWTAVRVIEVFIERTVRSRRLTEASGMIAITRLGGQFGKGIAVLAGAALILYDAGVNLTAMLTGLGVGGLAIAFAAQKTLENLFGGIMIASDRPIRVGDFCRAGEYSGVVESIGLRSTKIRTVDRTLVSVPNGQLSTLSLENFAMRDKIRFTHTARLRPETTSSQLRSVLLSGNRMLADHPLVEKASAHVRFVGLKNSAFEIELFAYVTVQSWDTFLGAQEELLLGLVDIVEASGSAFANPI
jgi:MscS family membrane protein